MWASASSSGVSPGRSWRSMYMGIREAYVDSRAYVRRRTSGQLTRRPRGVRLEAQWGSQIGCGGCGAEERRNSKHRLGGPQQCIVVDPVRHFRPRLRRRADRDERHRSGLVPHDKYRRAPGAVRAAGEDDGDPLLEPVVAVPYPAIVRVVTQARSDERERRKGVGLEGPAKLPVVERAERGDVGGACPAVVAAAVVGGWVVLRRVHAVRAERAVRRHRLLVAPLRPTDGADLTEQVVDAQPVRRWGSIVVDALVS